ncbi:MAG: hypothetical protein PHS46_02420 [Candidatus Omnitrophica bacterium]|nr:hypothetical protein [Candidatus Omnitrophota bacterium]
MNSSKSVLILNGSPKQDGGVSGNIGNRILSSLAVKGMRGVMIRIIDVAGSKERLDVLVDQINNSEAIILSCPLYIDSIPSYVIRAIEHIGESRKKTGGANVRLAVIMHCGFPEAFHNDVAIRIFRQFAIESRFEWIGGMAFGMAPIINNKLITFQCKNIDKAIKSMTDAIYSGTAIPEKAITLIARPFMPTMLYTCVGNILWRMIAFKNKALKINATPYAS